MNKPEYEGKTAPHPEEWTSKSRSHKRTLASWEDCLPSTYI